MDFSLRPAAASDHGFMVGVYAAASSEVHMERTYDVEHSSIIVVDGRDQGWQTIVMRNVDEIHIDSLFLLPASQGRGIGTKIITGLIAEARAKNLALSVCAVKTNTGARRLYERLGFAVTWSDDHRVCMLYAMP